MKIGIIGAGNIGSSLGKFWAQNGHQLMFSYSRDQTKLEKIVQTIGSNASVGIPLEAVQFADVVLLSVPYSAIADALKTAGSLEGKILFSCVNALLPDVSGLAVGTRPQPPRKLLNSYPLPVWLRHCRCLQKS